MSFTNLHRMLFNKCNHRILAATQRFQTSSAMETTPKLKREPREIKIPMRIKRGPTDILKALASTVQDDETGFHRKYHDDPWLLPSTHLSKKLNALSKEAGRKAALYMVKKFPTLFMWDQDEPRLDAWRPRAKPLTEDGEHVDETLLLDRIEKCWISNCVHIYERLKQENTPVSNETLVKLLEILCYYNGDEPIETDWTEKTFFRSLLQAPVKSPWKIDGTAMTIFDELEEKTSRAYSAVICGMAKFNEPTLCREFYEKMLEEKIKPDLNVYHALLRCTQNPKEPDEEWSAIETIFKSMRDDDVRPNVKTFNLALLALSRHQKKSDILGDRCMEIYREMIASNVKPSLTTYYCILNCHENRSNFGSYVDAVVTTLENQKFEMSMEEDDQFFSYTMGVVADRLENKKLAYRLHRNVLKIGDNYKFLNDFEAENFYYERLFLLLSRTEETKKFFEAYDALVPNVYSPTMDVFNEIVSNLELTGAIDRMPKMYTSMTHLGYGFIGRCVMHIMGVMYRAENLELDTRRALAETAYQIKLTIDSQFDLYIPDKNKDAAAKPTAPKFKPYGWTARMIIWLSILCARGGQFQRSYEIFEKLNPPSKIEEEIHAAMEKGTFPNSTPDFPALVQYVRLLLEANQLERCYGVLKYMAGIGFQHEVGKWVNVVVNTAGVHPLEKKLFQTLKTFKRKNPYLSRALPKKSTIPAVAVPDVAATEEIVETELNDDKV